MGLLSPEETSDLDDYNGEFWTELDELTKSPFLQGYAVGIKAVYYKTKEIKEVYSDPDIADAEDKKKAEVIDFVVEEIKYYYNAFGVSYKKLQRGLDDVYEDEENRVIPIHRVLTYVAEYLRGDMDYDLLQDYIADLRDEYAK